MRITKRLLVAVLLFVLAAAVPAQADCVTAGAYVQTGSTRRTVLPAGTCVAPTPFTTTFQYSRNVGVTGVAEVGVSAGLPTP